MSFELPLVRTPASAAYQPLRPLVQGDNGPHPAIGASSAGIPDVPGAHRSASVPAEKIASGAPRAIRARGSALTGEQTTDKMVQQMIQTEKSPAEVIPSAIAWHGSSELHSYFVVDVFTPNPLEGNQLGVFVDGRPLSDEAMTSVAREMKFAETVFLVPPTSGGDVRARIFTPTGEVSFAGHPVLGTAFVVAEALGADSVTLETGAGPVPIELERSGGRVVFGRMSQPVPTWAKFDREADVLDALKVKQSLLPIDLYSSGHVFIRLPSEEAVTSLKPDMGALERIDVAVNCFAGGDSTWKTRMFYPAAGVPEDPATGTAAGALAVHLARHQQIAFGQQIEIRQGSEVGRPSLIFASASGDGERITSVQLAGAAVIVAQGRYRIG